MTDTPRPRKRAPQINLRTVFAFALHFPPIHPNGLHAVHGASGLSARR
jgi:hypothetical protein